jgi:hypothetical protein
MQQVEILYLQSYSTQHVTKVLIMFSRLLLLAGKQKFKSGPFCGLLVRFVVRIPSNSSNQILKMYELFLLASYSRCWTKTVQLARWVAESTTMSQHPPTSRDPGCPLAHIQCHT